MRFLFLFLLFLSFAGPGQAALPVKEAALDEEFRIKYGEQVEVKDASLTITFRAVEEDSRCPEDVVCVWAGNARLRLEVKRSKKRSQVFSINTTLEPKEVVFKGYRIKLVGLKPQRKSGTPVAPADYEATLVVSSK